MITICILFPTLITNTFGTCDGASKQSLPPKILPYQGHAPGFEIPGSATVYDLKAKNFDHVNSKNAELA